MKGQRRKDQHLWLLQGGEPPAGQGRAGGQRRDSRVTSRLRDLPPPPMLPGAPERSWRRLEAVLQAPPEELESVRPRPAPRPWLTALASLGTGHYYMLRAVASLAVVAVLGAAAFGASAAGVGIEVPAPVRSLFVPSPVETPLPAPAAPAIEDVRAAPVSLSGRVVDLADGYVDLTSGADPVRVRVTDATAVEGKVVPDALLQVEGLRQADGSILAARVTVQSPPVPAPPVAKEPAREKPEEPTPAPVLAPRTSSSATAGDDRAAPTPVATSAAVSEDHIVAPVVSPVPATGDGQRTTVTLPSVSPVPSGGDSGSDTHSSPTTPGGETDSTGTQKPPTHESD